MYSVIVFMSVLGALATIERPLPASPIPETSRQLLMVTTSGWGVTSGTLRRYERDGDHWRPVGDAVDVVVGRSGLGWGRGLHSTPSTTDDPVKVEGDGRAPAGVFRLSAAFGYAASEATGLPYVQATSDLQCVDDRRSDAYNLVLDSTAVGGSADWASHERMRRRDGLYRIGVIVAHNGPGVSASVLPDAARLEADAPVAGGGSCIFLHVWRGPGSTTAGCTAMPDPALQEVLAWLDADADPVLVQLPASEVTRLRGPWELPE